MGRLPDRWLPYSSVGQPIEGTKFIAFKVPLKEAICNNLEPDERFTPSMLVEQCPRLSLVVDLTNTQRYYNPGEFLSKGIKYRKIYCPGKMIPSEVLVKKFIDIVDEYVKENGDSEESLIGVHCTHGLNRTAYFICNYMIKRLNISAQDAITAFEQARGHSIERQEYVKALLDSSDSDASQKSETQSFESPLGSLYEERPLNWNYGPKQNYQSRSAHDYYRRDYRRQNAMPYGQRNFYPKRPNPDNQRSGYDNHPGQSQYVRNNNNRRQNYNSDSWSSAKNHSQFFDHSTADYSKRPRDRDPVYRSESRAEFPKNAQQPDQKYNQKPRFTRVGDGLVASSTSANHSRFIPYAKDESHDSKFQKGKQKVSQRQPHNHSRHKRFGEDSHSVENDFESR